ncbi:MAG: FHA domain-containing protein [Planctomycetes bacterium]|jgi:pSer/pThr/pTyr-binding forkhead associated (FHA) protein|nr:FHA domain-containing protein [Planctomycetota bacterium]
MANCVTCGQENVAGSTYCNRCGKPLASGEGPGATRKPTDPSDRILVSRDHTGEVSVEKVRPPGRFFRQTCPWCGRSVKVPEGARSCPFCAKGLDRSAADLAGDPALASPEPRDPSRPGAVLKHALPTGDERRIALRFARCVVGRTQGVPPELVFPSDLYLSPCHGEFAFDGDRVRVRDRGSANGTYIRIREPWPLEDGMRLLMGEQVFRFEAIPFDTLPDAAAGEGTMPLGSGLERSAAKLVKLLADGGDGPEFHLGARTRVFGRETGHYTFPDDPMMSQRHAAIEEREGRFWLTDLGSTNGTMAQVRDIVLMPGDVVRMGSQRFRIEYGAARRT